MDPEFDDWPDDDDGDYLDDPLPNAADVEKHLAPLLAFHLVGVTGDHTGTTCETCGMGMFIIWAVRTVGTNPTGVLPRAYCPVCNEVKWNDGLP